MAAKATQTYATDTIQIHAVAESAGVLDVAGTVMKGVIRPVPVLRVSIVDTVTALATVATGAVDAKIKPRVAARAAGLTMAFLASCQIRLGIRAMIGSQEIAVIERMRCPLRSVGVATLSVKTDRVTAGCRLVTLQGLAVTGSAGLISILRSISAVVNIGISPA